MQKILILIVMLFTTTLNAESAAKVLFVKGKVTSGGGKSISRGVGLSTGDSLNTGADSAVNILYTNGTIVNLGEKTQYTIVAYNPKSSGVQLKTKLDGGKLKFKTTGKTKEEITTPITALAILGTEASVFSTSGATYLKVISGSVQAKGGTAEAGSSVVINRHGYSMNPFPPEGEVQTQEGAKGELSASTSSSSSSAGSSSTDNSSKIDNLTLATVQVTGTVEASAIAQIPVVELADIEILCLP